MTYMPQSTASKKRFISSPRNDYNFFESECFVKKIKTDWDYATKMPPTPAPPTPPPARKCFYETDYVTVKKDSLAFHSPFGQGPSSQEGNPIRNACGRVQKMICNDDALHLQ